MPARPGPDAGLLRADLPAGADLPGGTNPPTGAGPGTGPVRRRPGSAAIGAAVDVGANSVHLLVAVTRGHRLEPLVDESVFLGLGDNVNRTGELGSVSRAELVATLVRYVETARRLGARHVVLVGTEPLRRAGDAANAVEDVTRTTGVSLDVLSHEEEGYLTLIGVTSGRRVTAELMVVDVGGGSSELVVVSAVGGVRAAGVRLGSASLTASIVRHDPPTAEEIRRLARAAKRALVEAPDASPHDVVAVGGTASNVLRVLPAATLDRTLTRRRIAEALGILASEPWAVAAERHAVHPVRARILPAGAAILDAVLERFGVERLRVSDAGIREGGVLAAVRAGDAWRERLAELASGWTA